MHKCCVSNNKPQQNSLNEIIKLYKINQDETDTPCPKFGVRSVFFTVSWIFAFFSCMSILKILMISEMDFKNKENHEAHLTCGQQQVSRAFYIEGRCEALF